MSIFHKQYYYLSTKRSDGTPILFGALRNRGKDGTIGKGSLCTNENEARKAADDILRGKMYEIKTSKHSVLSEATKEWKASKLTQSGDLDMSTRRMSHILKDKRNKSVELEDNLDSL